MSRKEFDCKALRDCMEELAKDRPIFHSEADFQFALAWEINKQCDVKGIRLEYPFAYRTKDKEKTWYVDIVVLRQDGKMVPIELKYKRAKLSDFDIQNDGYIETFNLKQHGALDFGRYDCMKDVMKVERIIESNIDVWASEGYVIWLTNDKNYWAEVGDGDRDKDFSLHNHKIDPNKPLFWAIPELIEGNKRYVEDKKARKKRVGGRIEPIKLSLPHEIEWQPYSSEKGEEAGLYNEQEVKYALLRISKKGSYLS